MSSERFSTFRRSAGIFAVMFSAVLAAASAAMAQAVKDVQQIKTLAALPILVVFGDHRETPTGIGIRPSWQLSFESCQTLIGRLKAAGGQAEMLNPAERGIRGNIT